MCYHNCRYCTGDSVFVVQVIHSILAEKSDWVGSASSSSSSSSSSCRMSWCGKVTVRKCDLLGLFVASWSCMSTAYCLLPTKSEWCAFAYAPTNDDDDGVGEVSCLSVCLSVCLCDGADDSWMEEEEEEEEEEEDNWIRIVMHAWLINSDLFVNISGGWVVISRGEKERSTNSTRKEEHWRSSSCRNIA